MAYLRDEKGGTVVRPLIRSAVISAVNWSEVLQKLRGYGYSTDEAREMFESGHLTIATFGADDAESVARLWKKGTDLSLADRACLALAIDRKLPVVTADRAWQSLHIPGPVLGSELEIQLLR